MIRLFDKDSKIIKYISDGALLTVHQNQRLTDEGYISEQLTVQMNILDDDVFNDAEYMTIPAKGHDTLHHLFWIKDKYSDNRFTHLTGVLEGIEELSKTPVIDVRPQDATLRSAVEQVLNGTNYIARYVADTGRRSSNAYFTDVWSALKRYASVWRVEMQLFVEVTETGIGARYIDFREQVGVNDGARVVYGHNALEILKEEERAEIYTALIGRGNGEEVGESEEGDATFGRKINFKDVEWKKSDGAPLDKPLGQYYLELPEATERYGIKYGNSMKPKIGFVDVDSDDEEEVLELTHEALMQVSRPKVMFRASAVYLKGDIGDTVRVVRKDRSIDYDTRIFDITHDRLEDSILDIKLGDNMLETQAARERRITGNAAVKVEEQINNNLVEHVQYIVSANGLNRNYYSRVDPRDEGFKPMLNDIWYRPDPDSEGDTILYIWNGSVWEEVTRTFNNTKVADLIKDVQDLKDAVAENVEITIDNIIDILDGASEVNLAHIFARLIGDDRFSTLFYQEAENIGFVYREGDEVKSIIAIQNGTPFIRGEHIILDGNTIVDGDFTVTESMIADEAIVEKLKVTGIDAAEIRVINLDFDSMAGGDIELARGIRITNNGAVVMEVTSDGKFLFDATAAGVATKQELENIELTPGPPGYTPIKGVDYFDGVDGQDGEDGDSSYLWVMYSQNASGSGMVDNPTNAVYIGVATTTTPTKPSTPSAYQWSLIKGEDGVEGEKGSDGRTSYLHIKYSNDGGQTFTANNGESVGDWIGTYVDFTQADSNNVSDYTWNKVKGEKGDKGDDGIQGPKGADGKSQYIHIRYSANSNGSGMTTSPQSNTKYIGLANTNSSTAPSGYSSYTWSKYRGEDGNQGIQGPPGENGEPTYTWVKYADTPTSGMSDSPDGKKYIGLAFNKSSPNESNSYSQYTWSLMPQNIALGVRNLVPWTNFTDYRDNISKWTTWSATFIWRASQIGKYMLFRNSNTDRTGTTTIGVISPPFHKDVEAGKTYTLRFLGNTSSTNNPFGYSYLMNVDGVQKEGGTGTGNQGLPSPTVIEEYERFTASDYANLYEITFSPTWNGPAAIMLASTIDASKQSSHYISEVMLVEGDSISRDWQPAPEDVEQLMHNNVDGKIDDVNAELSEHWEAIGDKVSITAFTDAMNSMKADYEDGLIEASKVPARVDELLSRNEAMISKLGENIAKWEFLDTHVKMGNEGLYIGEIEGDSSLLIGTDRISFMQGQNEIAYISGQQMYINRSINLESVQIGSHIQMKINNNLTVIQWVGG